MRRGFPVLYREMKNTELQEDIARANRVLISSRRAAESQSGNRQRQIQLIEGLLSLGRLRVSAGDITRGISCYREGVDRSHSPELGFSASDELVWCSWMAYCLDSEGALEEARDFYNDSVSIVEKSGLEENERLGIIHNNLAMIHRQMEDEDVAEVHYKKALEEFSKQKGLRSIEVADVLHNLGVLNYFRDRYNDAIEYFKQSLSIRTDQLPEIHDDVCQCYANLAALYQRIGDEDEAKLYYEQSTRNAIHQAENYEIMISRKMDSSPPGSGNT